MSASFVVEEGAYGPRLAMTGSWADEARAYMEREGIDELYLNYARGWKGDDLRFLSRLGWLKAFTILDWKIQDVSPIHSLTELLMLEVSTYCKTPIHFGSFPKLEECRLSWRAGADSVFSCGTLRRFVVSEYGERSTTSFTGLQQLESLSIVGGEVERLDGLGSLRRLRFLGLYNLRRLRSLAGIEKLSQLEGLEINECPLLHRIDEIGQLKNLRRLELNENGKIETLKPLEQLRELREVFFYGSTSIADGNLTPLSVLPHLEKTSFQNRRHYTHTREALHR